MNPKHQIDLMDLCLKYMSDRQQNLDESFVRRRAIMSEFEAAQKQKPDGFVKAHDRYIAQTNDLHVANATFRHERTKQFLHQIADLLDITIRID
jgi:hypothetical protein